MKEKQFIDEAWINIESGRGGDGLQTFHKEKNLSRGGPSGGNGGNGGSIYFIGDSGENTLLDFKSNRVFKAKPGIRGGSNNCTGANGEDLYIKTPLGTQFFDEEGNYLFEILRHEQSILALKGGKGGRGNSSFKSSKNPSPELYENGELGGVLKLKLNLKVLADVGLLGFPNSGKSTFISVVSNAKPKIGSYPFTTLVPKLGLVKHNNYKFVVSDLPGLIEDASENKGMGIQFLKHLERTKIILHLIDISELEKVKEKYLILRNELKKFSEELSEKKEIIVLTKSDLVEGFDEEIEEIIAELKPLNPNIVLFSSLTKENMTILLNDVVETLIASKDEIDEVELRTDVIFKYIKETNNDDLAFEIEHPNTREWIVSGKYVQYWGNRIPMQNTENFWRLYNKLQSKGIIDALLERGLSQGDWIRIKDTSFELQYFDDED